MYSPLVMLARAYNMDGQFASAESAIQESIRLQQDKTNPHSPLAALSQLVLAQALAGQQKPAEALIHAQAANSLYSGNAALSPDEKESAAQAQQLVQQLGQK